MQVEDTAVNAQREVLGGMEAFVEEKLALLVPPDKAWQPTDFLPNLVADDWREQVGNLRAQAAGLSDPLLVVLVAGMVTEEALPNYSIALNIIAQDRTGTGTSPWARWMRGWTSEENRHGDLLNSYLRLSGRVDMRAVELTVHHLLNNGFDPRVRDELYGGLVYTAFQERATKISHTNVGRLAAAGGDEALERICRRVAGDEARHEAFYTAVMGRVLDDDPEGGMVSVMSMFRRVIAMPGRLMFDGRDPDLFEHFAAVAQRLGVYTAFDYAGIVEHLVGTWGIAGRSVSGKAARAQDYLCQHAERCRTVAAQVAESVARAEPVRFSWIFDRAV
jgi:acyl-[acyl-carrier-protein] desaturase